MMRLAEQGITNSGFDELALLSLSTGDYSCLPELLTELMDRFTDEHVSVALPSMRVGTLTPEVIEQIKRVRKSGFTVAPEAGTDRLRQVINKGITEQDLLTGCRDAFSAGWNVMKFYFMIGLPTETMEDIDGIIDLAIRAGKEAQGRRSQINVSVSSFVPKPHTSFQWSGQLSIEETKKRINYLKSKLPRKGFKLKWHEPYQSFLEGVFSRGDRRLARLIEASWKAGARLDGWSDHFLLERWEAAATQLEIDLDAYLRPRDREEALPWDHLSCGVDRRFLQQEYEKALDQVYTPDCRNHGCQQCGLCDFKTIQPVIHTKTYFYFTLSSIPLLASSSARLFSLRGTWAIDQLSTLA
ncbi:MAG: radical SAM protein, partial [Candidatus Electrothrix sp. AR4]|nr:radical SAM protein [Candidatus Electrothrix sp. AR4]